MYKKALSLLIVFVLFSLPSAAFAGLFIGEIMYDLSGSDSTDGKSREWIEVYNPDTNAVSVDASKWRLYDGSANRTMNGEVDFSIPSGAYIIFAGDRTTFLADHPGFLGVVYDTGITSLNNTGATLKILDQDSTALDNFTYASAQGASGDGNSLQKISGAWQGKTPTPGAANEMGAVNSSSNPSNSNSPASATPSSNPGAGGGIPGSSSDLSSTQSKTQTADNQKIRTEIIADIPAFVGLPLTLKSLAFGKSGEELHYGKYFWNFGDGDSLESKVGDSGKLAHTYFYPGEYVVGLEYYMNIYSSVPDASAQMVIKAVPVDLAISAVGDAEDFFIELTNNTDYLTDLSGWMLVSALKTFPLPRNTHLEAKKKLTLSARLTGFSVADRGSLKLVTAQGDIAFTYVPFSAKPVIAPPKMILAKSDSATSTKSIKAMSLYQDLAINVAEHEKEKTTVVDDLQISDLDLQASVLAASPKPSRNFYLYLAGLVLLLVLALATVYFVRRRAVSSLPGDDFEILDG